VEDLKGRKEPPPSLGFVVSLGLIFFVCCGGYAWLEAGFVDESVIRRNSDSVGFLPDQPVISGTIFRVHNDYLKYDVQYADGAFDLVADLSTLMVESGWQESRSTSDAVKLSGTSMDTGAPHTILIKRLGPGKFRIEER